MSQVLLLVAYLVTIVGIIGAYLYLQRKPVAKVAAAAERPAAAAPQPARAQPAQPQPAQPARQAPAARRAPVESESESDSGSDQDAEDEQGEEPEDDTIPIPDDIRLALERGTKLTNDQKRTYDKIQKKNEKAANRRASEQANEAKRKKEESRNEAAKRRDEERAAERRKKAEEERLAREAEKKEADDMLGQWKDFIAVETHGSVEQDVASESQGMLQEFLDYIKNSKVVVLEDLAAEFNLRTQDCVKRIKSLELSGLLTGVIDDRGKYIYISPQEIENVALFIEKRGRIGITDLVAQSNTLINLKGAQIKKEATAEPAVPSPATASK